MSTFKRTISLLLVLGILLGIVAPSAQAAPAEDAASVNTDTVTVEGTNGFGSLLSQEITESQEEAEAEAAEYSGGYTVTDLVIEDGVATVTYDSMEEATLVVALYTEDGMQLLTSAKATVTPDATEATVTFEGEMPEYFMASAYLLDGYDFSPLCAAYDTPMYTREMQELLASTVEDYDPEKVLNLDDDDTTNFAVYAESTIVIEAAEGVNTVAVIDDENATYVIENADEQITSLAVGDVFVYHYAEDAALISKIDTITVDGTTVTITGADLEMEKVFAYVKIDAVADSKRVEVDENYIGDGVTYLQSGANISGTYLPQDTGVSEEVVVDYILDIKGDINLTGKLTAKAKLKLEFYITDNHQRITLALDYSLAIGAEVEADFTSKPISVPIGMLKFPVLPGVSVEFVPSFVFSATVTANLTLNFDGTFGVAFNHTKNGWDVDNLCTTPDPYLELGVEGKIFAGLQLTPALKLLGGFLADIEIKGQLGLQLTGKVAVSTELISDMRHNCVGCIEGELAFVLKITPSVQFLKSDKLKLETTLVNASFKVNDFYISPMSGIGWGECPNITYKLTLVAEDEAGNLVADAIVTIDEGSDFECQTNEKGIAQLYLTSDIHSIEVQKGNLRYWTEFVMDHSRKLTAELKDPSSSAEPGDSTDAGNILDFADDWLKSELVDYEEALQNDQVTFGGHTYTMFDDVVSTWEEAEAYCESLGGHLATITSAEEDVFLYTYLESCGKQAAFFGLNDLKTEGVWEWVTGEPVVYTNWCAGEPNNSGPGEEDVCSYSYVSPGKWNDSIFDNAIFANSDTFLCEWDYEITEPDGEEGYPENNTLTPNAVYPGDYSTDITDAYTVKMASFKDLVPNEQYVLLAMASIEVEDPLAADNLLFIDQAAALEDGTLVFEYVQRTSCEISYVMVCGASHKNLNDGEITFPEMVADGDLQVVDPVVVYDGVTLTEGLDYVIVGRVDFTDAGEFTCYIRGIHNYTGLVECVYRVKSAQQENPFTDVPPGSYFYEPVLWALEKGITAGVDATHFGPNVACTRAQVVTFLWSAAGKPEPATTVNPFVDVAVSDWYYKAVLWAYENKITSGVDATHFGSAAVCTREQVVTFLWSSKNKPDSSIEVTFADVKPGMYFYDAVAWAVENKVTSGMGDGTFGAGKTCTRAQVVTFLYAVR